MKSTLALQRTLVCLGLAFSLAAPVLAQDKPDEASGNVTVTSNQVTIASNGKDIRGILFDLFTQAKKSFVLEPNTHFVLYLALTGVEFDEALEIVCHTAGLKYELNNGIYFLSKDATQPAVVKPEIKAEPKPLGQVTERELQKKLTTRLSKTDIREVFAEFARQSGIAIEVDKKVPAYKVDAFLIDTSLKYALDVVTRATGLEYVKTENRTLLIKLKS